MYGSDTPPPPPDYTYQRQQEAQAEYQSRLQQANAYNALVDKYNSELRNFGSQVMNYGSGFSRLGIADLKNKSEYTGLEDLQKQLAGLRFDNERPNWSPTITSYGQSVSVGVPTLKTVDTNYAANIDRMLSQYRSSLDNLYNQRQVEEDRVANYTNAFSGDIEKALGGLSDLKIEDLAGLQAARNFQYDLASRQRGFRSVLDPDGLAEYNDELARITDGINKMFADRKAEEDRIKAYRTGLSGDVASFSKDLRGLTIADLEKLNGLNDKVDDRILDIGTFESPLTFDFNNYLSQFNAYDQRIETLLQQRKDEEERIKTAQERALANSEDYLDSAKNMDFYSRSMIDDLNRRLTLGERELGTFKSLLPYDFKDSQANIDAAQELLTKLLAERETNLANIKTKGGSLDDDLASVDLWNEDEYNNRLEELRTQLEDLSQYSGYGVSPIARELTQVQRAIEKRLRELSAYRGTVETDAQKYIAELKRNGLYNVADVQALLAGDGRLAKLRSDIDKYKAYGADDEYDMLSEYLNSELSRLQEEARQKAALAERERLAAGGGSSAQVYMLDGVPLSEAEYLALIQQRKKDALYSGATTNAFTSGLAG